MTTQQQGPCALTGRTAVVTGVSRRQGIGYAIASRLAGLGASLFVQHWAHHDHDQPWGGDDLDAVRAGLTEQLVGDAVLADASIDLGTDSGPQELIADAAEALGHLDILVCNQARSGGDGRLADQTVDSLDAHWRVNTRATLLATRDFAARHDGRPGGRVVWLTSGQQLGPMANEIAYASSKAALAGVTASVADDLIERGITLNTVNPGPVDTGYLTAETSDRADWLPELLAHCPSGRFGEPDDPARLIAWLVSDEGRWVVGQVINSEGGFRRWS
ncbi:SDR family oxidoreductase [Microlunatus sp. Y2014]|uniref:SDR family oxidoreductase n=1 Tax=Microlunatus sp. Y2014 TaxID=3418488 RepID=UPI003DA76E6A